MIGFTVTLNVAVVAHWPAVGVNVYVPEVELLTVAGFQVPVIPFVDVFGNDGTLPLSHIVNDVPNANDGVMFGVTVTLNVAAVAHWPASGVNVYVPELFGSTTAGLQVPVIALVDVFGNVGTAPPAHIFNDVPKANVGVIFGFTATLNVEVVAH